MLQTINWRSFTITEKAPTMASFSWLTSAFTFKTLLKHYSKRALIHAMVSRHEIGTKIIRDGLVSIVSYSCPSLMIITSGAQFHIYLPWDQRLFSIVS